MCLPRNGARIILALFAAGTVMGGCGALSADYRTANATAAALFQSLREVGLECPSPDRRSPIGETPQSWDCDDSRGWGVWTCATQRQCDDVIDAAMQDPKFPKDFVYLLGSRWIIYGGPLDRGNLPWLEEIEAKVGGKIVIVPGSE